MRRLLISAAMLTCLPLGSCLGGRIYTQTIRPFDTNLRDTAIGGEAATSDSKDFNYSYVRIVWGGFGIAEAAKAAGLQEVYFADLETISVLGIWTQQWIHVYGR